jgi:acetyltransferase-like isoleucine patch superfamily enzyme
MGFRKDIILRLFSLFNFLKRRAYAAISKEIVGSPTILQATIFEGNGKISFGNNVILGYYPSPKFYEGAMYIEAREASAVIAIGDCTIINNNCTIVADKSSITIGKNCLIGANVEILDSDFHSLSGDRKSSDYECWPVVIGDNVFVGNNVKILKGSKIGNNSVVGNGSLVTKAFPENVILAGFPAKIIRSL